MCMKSNLDIIKEKFKDSFDIKYREINGILGKTTLVFIDNLCSTQFLSDYIVTPIKNKKTRCYDMEDLITNKLAKSADFHWKEKQDI